MARKTDADLLAELDALGAEEATPSTTTAASNATPAAAATTPTQPPPQPQPSSAAPPATSNEALDSLDDLQKALAARPITPAPRLSSSSQRSAGTGTGKSPKRSGVGYTSNNGNGNGSGRESTVEYTPAASSSVSEEGSGRGSEERGRLKLDGEAKYGDNAAMGGSAGGSVGSAPAASAVVQSGSGGGGGWWGSMFSAATAAVSQAQILAKELRENEEAQKWAEQVRGVGVGLQSLSTDLRTKALPTFTNILTHIAPPISAHERLNIHTTHDLRNYPSLDPLIYNAFSRVMSQVEGGDLVILQRGEITRTRSGSVEGYRGNNSLAAAAVGGVGGGWSEGPWWRDESSKRDLGVVEGLREGTRLCRVSAESFAREWFDAAGGVEAVRERAMAEALEGGGGGGKGRSSDIFLAIQAISYPVDNTLFASSPTDAAAGPDSTPETEQEYEVVFALHLHDPLHALSFSAVSQPLPLTWANWLDAPSPFSPETADSPDALPESIIEIIEAGGVDPREWVAEWMEEVLGLAVGVVAQRYVARRMGVDVGVAGEGGLRAARGSGEVGVGGEEARAV